MRLALEIDFVSKGNSFRPKQFCGIPCEDDSINNVGSHTEKPRNLDCRFFQNYAFAKPIGLTQVVSKGNNASRLGLGFQRGLQPEVVVGMR
jgi:hypothetical protein